MPIIEVTCAACSTTLRIPDVALPPNATAVTCTNASCKQKVPLPGRGGAKPAAAAAAMPSVPTAKPPLPSIKPPAIPKVGGATPPIPTPRPPGPLSGAVAAPVVPEASGNTGDVLDLADLPRPQRRSALAEPEARPA